MLDGGARRRRDGGDGATMRALARRRSAGPPHARGAASDHASRPRALRAGRVELLAAPSVSSAARGRAAKRWHPDETSSVGEEAAISDIDLARVVERDYWGGALRYHLICKYVPNYHKEH